MCKYHRLLQQLVIIMLLLVVVSTQVSATTYYYVRKGDTLWLIAQQYGVSVAEIQAANRLKNTTIYQKQRLIIPDSTSSTDTWVYTVKPGDTLFLLAQRYGTTVNTLRELNGLTGDTLLVGANLRMPNGDKYQQPINGTWTYTVQSGDTLFLIAQRYGTSVSALRVLNNLWTDNLNVGQRLLIEGHPPAAKSPSTYSQADIDLLARLVSAEALGEPFEGMVAVAAVVLHRVVDPRYPNTIPDVIYQVTNTYYYQFSPVLDGRINEPASQLAFQAVKKALAGSDPSGGAIGFYNPQKTSNAWVRAQEVTSVIGQHVFYRY